MDKQKFLEDPNVTGFVSWVARILPELTVYLDISSAGTGRANGQRGPGVSGTFKGLSEIVNAYHWRASWQDNQGKEVFSGDWETTRDSLFLLSQWIRYEVDQGSQEGSLAAAKAIVKWGGDRGHARKPPVGAIPFLESLPDLQGYLRTARDVLSLEKANTDDLKYILEMNAMLTKVHALLAEDGLPIYDSRVAAAAGALVERYRRSIGLSWIRIPEVLRFRATDRVNRRRVVGLREFDHLTLDPGVFDRQNRAVCASDWSSAKVRLGWLLGAILGEAERIGCPLIEPGTTADESLPAQMHAFEAGLFMIGFDVRCL